MMIWRAEGTIWPVASGWLSSRWTAGKKVVLEIAASRAPYCALVLPALSVEAWASPLVTRRHAGEQSLWSRPAEGVFFVSSGVGSENQELSKNNQTHSATLENEYQIYRFCHQKIKNTTSVGGGPVKSCIFDYSAPWGVAPQTPHRQVSCGARVLFVGRGGSVGDICNLIWGLAHTHPTPIQRPTSSTTNSLI